MNQSIVSVAHAIAATMGGYLTSISMNLPTLFAAATTFVAWIIFVTVFKVSRKEKAVLEG